VQNPYVVKEETGQEVDKDSFDPSAYVSVGQFVTGVLIKVDYSHYSVDISLRSRDTMKLNNRPSDMANEPLTLRGVKIPDLVRYFDVYSADADFDEQMRIKAKNIAAYSNKIKGEGEGEGAASNGGGGGGGGVGKMNSKFNTRNCLHPIYRNASRAEVEAELDERFVNQGGGAIGSCLLRPSSSKRNCLTLTWALRRGLYKNYNLLEKDKPHDTAIGRRLILLDSKENEIDTFAEIDEILSRLVEPLNMYLEEMTNSKTTVAQKYVDVLAGEKRSYDQIEYGIDERLKADFKTNPKTGE